MSQQTVFNGRYELHRRLARGGMADVFLARDQLLDRPVAVKVLFPEFATDPSFVERFRREAQSAANLNHPNIVSVYDWGQEQGTYFIVMEYIEGRSLADILRTDPLHPQRAAEVTSDIASALGFAHRNGVVHRDVKPGNVLISPSGQVKVADFGIARALGADPESNLTQAGSVMGTATYFAPEQAQGLPLDPRSDLYSLGVVLYEMVAGRPPFGGESPVAIAYKHVQETPDPPRQVNPNVPPDLEAIILKLLSKNPQARYPSADDLRADLRRFREGQPVLAAGAAVGSRAAAPAVGATQAVATTQAVPGYEGTRAVAVNEYGAPYEERRRSGAFLVALILLLLILAGLLFALGRVLTGDNGGAEQVSYTVQQGSVVGKPEADAIKALNTAGFEVTSIERKPNTDVPEGIVVSVDPQEGTTVNVDKDKRPEAKLVVSQGADTVKMPQVTGLTLDRATKLLADMKFTNVTSQEAPSDDPNVKKGDVFQQDPAVGADVKLDAPVVLTVSSGKTPVTIPGVKGKTVDEARSALRGAGLVDAPATRETASDSVPKGQVMGTDPAEGQQVDKGSTVTIIVSGGPAQVSVPDVSSGGITKGAADSTITGAGLKPEGHCSGVDPGQSGSTKVTSQDPGANTKVEKGSTVRYFYTAKNAGDCTP